MFSNYIKKDLNDLNYQNLNYCKNIYIYILDNLCNFGQKDINYNYNVNINIYGFLENQKEFMLTSSCKKNKYKKFKEELNSGKSIDILGITPKIYKGKGFNFRDRFEAHLYETNLRLPFYKFDGNKFKQVRPAFSSIYDENKSIFDNHLLDYSDYLVTPWKQRRFRNMLDLFEGFRYREIENIRESKNLDVKGKRDLFINLSKINKYNEGLLDYIELKREPKVVMLIRKYYLFFLDYKKVSEIDFKFGKTFDVLSQLKREGVRHKQKKIETRITEDIETLKNEKYMTMFHKIKDYSISSHNLLLHSKLRCKIRKSRGSGSTENLKFLIKDLRKGFLTKILLKNKRENRYYIKRGKTNRLFFKNIEENILGKKYTIFPDLNIGKRIYALTRGNYMDETNGFSRKFNYGFNIESFFLDYRIGLFNGRNIKKKRNYFGNGLNYGNIKTYYDNNFGFFVNKKGFIYLYYDELSISTVNYVNAFFNFVKYYNDVELNYNRSYLGFNGKGNQEQKLKEGYGSTFGDKYANLGMYRYYNLKSYRFSEDNIPLNYKFNMLLYLKSKKIRKGGEDLDKSILSMNKDLYFKVNRDQSEKYYDYLYVKFYKNELCDKTIYKDALNPNFFNISKLNFRNEYVIGLIEAGVPTNDTIKDIYYCYLGKHVISLAKSLIMFIKTERIQLPSFGFNYIIRYIKSSRIGIFVTNRINKTNTGESLLYNYISILHENYINLKKIEKEKRRLFRKNKIERDFLKREGNTELSISEAYVESGKLFFKKKYNVTNLFLKKEINFAVLNSYKFLKEKINNVNVKLHHLFLVRIEGVCLENNLFNIPLGYKEIFKKINNENFKSKMYFLHMYKVGTLTQFSLIKDGYGSFILEYFFKEKNAGFDFYNVSRPYKYIRYYNGLKAGRRHLSGDSLESVTRIRSYLDVIIGKQEKLVLYTGKLFENNYYYLNYKKFELLKENIYYLSYIKSNKIIKKIVSDFILKASKGVRILEYQLSGDSLLKKRHKYMFIHYRKYLNYIKYENAFSKVNNRLVEEKKIYKKYMNNNDFMLDPYIYKINIMNGNFCFGINVKVFDGVKCIKFLNEDIKFRSKNLIFLKELHKFEVKKIKNLYKCLNNELDSINLKLNYVLNTMRIVDLFTYYNEYIYIYKTRLINKYNNDVYKDMLRTDIFRKMIIEYNYLKYKLNKLKFFEINGYIMYYLRFFTLHKLHIKKNKFELIKRYKACEKLKGEIKSEENIRTQKIEYLRDAVKHFVSEFSYLHDVSTYKNYNNTLGYTPYILKINNYLIYKAFGHIYIVYFIIYIILFLGFCIFICIFVEINNYILKMFIRFTVMHSYKSFIGYKKIDDSLNMHMYFERENKSKLRNHYKGQSNVLPFVYLDDYLSKFDKDAKHQYEYSSQIYYKKYKLDLENKSKYRESTYTVDVTNVYKDYSNKSVKYNRELDILYKKNIIKFNYNDGDRSVESRRVVSFTEDNNDLGYLLIGLTDKVDGMSNDVYLLDSSIFSMFDQVWARTDDVFDKKSNIEYNDLIYYDNIYVKRDKYVFNFVKNDLGFKYNEIGFNNKVKFNYLSDLIDLSSDYIGCENYKKSSISAMESKNSLFFMYFSYRGLLKYDGFFKYDSSSINLIDSYFENIYLNNEQISVETYEKNASFYDQKLYMLPKTKKVLNNLQRFDLSYVNFDLSKFMGYFRNKGLPSFFAKVVDSFFDENEDVNINKYIMYKKEIEEDIIVLLGLMFMMSAIFGILESPGKPVVLGFFIGIIIMSFPKSVYDYIYSKIYPMKDVLSGITKEEFEFFYKEVIEKKLDETFVYSKRGVNSLYYIIKYLPKFNYIISIAKLLLKISRVIFVNIIECFKKSIILLIHFFEFIIYVIFIFILILVNFFIYLQYLNSILGKTFRFIFNFMIFIYLFIILYISIIFVGLFLKMLGFDFEIFIQIYSKFFEVNFCVNFEKIVIDCVNYFFKDLKFFYNTKMFMHFYEKIKLIFKFIEEYFSNISYIGTNFNLQIININKDIIYIKKMIVGIREYIFIFLGQGLLYLGSIDFNKFFIVFTGYQLLNIFLYVILLLKTVIYYGFLFNLIVLLIFTCFIYLIIVKVNEKYKKYYYLNIDIKKIYIKYKKYGILKHFNNYIYTSFLENNSYFYYYLYLFGKKEGKNLIEKLKLVKFMKKLKQK